MPINPNALSSPDPNEADQTVAAAQDADMAAQQPVDAPEPAKKQRRTKVQMIADAVIPGDAEMVEVKDSSTGAKVQRAWREAVGLVASGAVEFVDKTLKYAVLKMEQQAAAPAFAQGSDDDAVGVGGGLDAAAPGGTTSRNEQASSVPPGAAVGDEVRVGTGTLYVGHGGVLTSGVVAVDGVQVKAKRRWQRELGTGANGPWESVALTQTSEQRPIFDEKVVDPSVPVEPVFTETGAFDGLEPTQNGNGGAPEVTVQTEKLPHTTEELPNGIMKIGTGTLDKIGLPDYSSLQIGPITMSRSIQDDGRRTTKTVNGREVVVITAAIEAFEELDNTVEYVASRFRGQLQSFLEATGALKQPVS